MKRFLKVISLVFALACMGVIPALPDTSPPTNVLPLIPTIPVSYSANQNALIDTISAFITFFNVTNVPMVPQYTGGAISQTQQDAVYTAINTLGDQNFIIVNKKVYVLGPSGGSIALVSMSAWNTYIQNGSQTGWSPYAKAYFQYYTKMSKIKDITTLSVLNQAVLNDTTGTFVVQGNTIYLLKVPTLSVSTPPFLNWITITAGNYSIVLTVKGISSQKVITVDQAVICNLLNWSSYGMNVDASKWYGIAQQKFINFLISNKSNLTSVNVQAEVNTIVASLNTSFAQKLSFTGNVFSQGSWGPNLFLTAEIYPSSNLNKNNNINDVQTAFIFNLNPVTLNTTTALNTLMSMQSQVNGGNAGGFYVVSQGRVVNLMMDQIMGQISYPQSQPSYGQLNFQAFNASGTPMLGFYGSLNCIPDTDTAKANLLANLKKSSNLNYTPGNWTLDFIAGDACLDQFPDNQSTSMIGWYLDFTSTS